MSNERSWAFSRRSTVGEGRVWLCGMGLALGIAMVVFLLGIIVVKGTEVFWPDRVAVIRLKAGSSSAPGNSGILAGTLVKKQEKTDKSGQEEWQMFLGNKDAYGIAFTFVDASEIDEITYEENIFIAERLEYGDAIGYPLELRLEDGSTIDAQAESFESTLSKLVHDADRRRDEIDRIERGEIGAVNRRMVGHRTGIRMSELDSTLSEQEREASRRKHEDAIDVLQVEYEALAKRASALRAKQNADQFAYGLPGGGERALPVGALVHYYYPNRIGLLERVGLSFSQVWSFLSEDPREANTEGGIFPAIFGTFVMTVLMSVLVTPFGIIAAIYLREYARQGLFVRSVRISVNNLAGVPSIVFGVVGLGFFVYLVGGTIDSVLFKATLPTPTFGTGGIFWASLTLALLTLPVVIVATEEALAAVPRGVREAALACGASKWQMIQRVILPSATPGVLTGIILAMARGAGEVAPLMLVGVVKMAPSLPIDSIAPFVHPERKFMHLGFHIYDLGFQSPDSEAAKPMVFATTFLLIVLVVVMNLAAISIRNHLKKKYAVGTF